MSVSRSSARLVGFVALAMAAGGAAQETNGLLVGDGRLHPYIDLEGRYDSAAIVDQNGNTSGDFIFHIRPGLLLDAPGPNFAVTLSGDADALLYLNNFSTLSHVQGEADANIGVNREGSVGLEVGDHFVRSDQAAAALIGLGVLSWYNDARLSVPVRPGGGALTVEPGFNWTLEEFDQWQSQANVSQFNYMNYRVSLLATWKFLPKTGLQLDGDYIFRDYASAGGTGTPTNGFHAQVGLVGLLTTHIATVFKIGWGEDIGTNSFGVAGVNNLIGHFELAYIPSETIRIAAGFVRTWQPVGGIQNVVTFIDNRPYAEIRFLLGGRLSFHAYGALDYMQYAGSGTGALGRSSDLVAHADPTVEYEFFTWFRASVGYVFSTFLVNGDAANTSSYVRNEVFLRLHFQY